MEKIWNTLTDKRVVASLISISILTLIFLAGPVQAFILGLTINNSQVNQGKNITFIVTLNISKTHEILPIKNFTLTINGPASSINSELCVFNVAGEKLSECKGIVSITRIKTKSENSRGYGYSYGYGYEYGYGYGYGYDYGYGYGRRANPIFKYKIILNTLNYSTGTYNTTLKVDIGNNTVSKKGGNIIINAKNHINPVKPIIPKHHYSKIFISTFVRPPINLTNSSIQIGNETNKTWVDGDNRTSPKGSSGITGNVIGFMGTRTGVIVVLFLVLLLAGIIFVLYKRRHPLSQNN